MFPPEFQRQMLVLFENSRKQVPVLRVDSLLRTRTAANTAAEKKVKWVQICFSLISRDLINRLKALKIQSTSINLVSAHRSEAVICNHVQPFSIHHSNFKSALWLSCLPGTTAPSGFSWPGFQPSLSRKHSVGPGGTVYVLLWESWLSIHSFFRFFYY